MSVHVGIDFGTTTTVIAVYDPVSGGAETVNLAPLTADVEQNGHRTHFVPSLVHYSASATLVGAPARAHLNDSSTIKWMKPTIVHEHYDGPRRVADGRDVTLRQAGADLLGSVRSRLDDLAYEDVTVCFTVPVHSFEPYTAWLESVAADEGWSNLKFVDEASAAAAGYEAAVHPGDSYMVFDFGGGTLDVAVVQAQGVAGDGSPRMRILGKSGADIGGRNIDAWLVEWAESELGLDPQTGNYLRNQLVASAERAKEELSSAGSATISAIDPRNGRTRRVSIDSATFESLLDANNLFDRIEETMKSALRRAAAAGVHDDDLKFVVTVGGSSIMPAVQRHLRRRFGSQRVRLDRPIDAVARGAALVAAGMQVDNCLYHRYELRYLADGEEKFAPVFDPGTEYPTPGWPWSQVITSTSPNQGTFHLEFYETDPHRVVAGGVEIVYRSDGSADVARSRANSGVVRSKFHLEEIQATPSGVAGEACLDVDLRVDDARRLVIRVRDIRNGKVIMDDVQVVRLK